MATFLLELIFPVDIVKCVTSMMMISDTVVRLNRRNTEWEINTSRWIDQPKDKMYNPYIFLHHLRQYKAKYVRFEHKKYDMRISDPCLYGTSMQTSSRSVTIYYETQRHRLRIKY